MWGSVTMPQVDFPIGPLKPQSPRERDVDHIWTAARPGCPLARCLPSTTTHDTVRLDTVPSVAPTNRTNHELASAHLGPPSLPPLLHAQTHLALPPPSPVLLTRSGPAGAPPWGYGSCPLPTETKNAWQNVVTEVATLAFCDRAIFPLDAPGWSRHAPPDSISLTLLSFLWRWRPRPLALLRVGRTCVQGVNNDLGDSESMAPVWVLQ